MSQEEKGSLVKKYSRDEAATLTVSLVRPTCTRLDFPQPAVSAYFIQLPWDLCSFLLPKNAFSAPKVQLFSTKTKVLQKSVAVGKNNGTYGLCITVKGKTEHAAV